MKNLKKGDKVKVTENEIFKIMGYRSVTGTVFSFHDDNSGFSMKCKETGAIEGVEFGDGEVEILEAGQ